jgi:hypothetical protein
MANSNRNSTSFLFIFAIMLLLEIPGCIIVCADDAGQIGSFKHETLIELSNATFAAPLILITGTVNSFGELLMIYIGNLLLLSSLIFYLVKILYYRKNKVSARQ